MRSTFICIATAFLAGGCSPNVGSPTAGAQSASIPELGAMDWPRIRNYCTFFADGHAFDAEDESTWQFVFVRTNTPSRRDAWAVAALDGERQMLTELSRRESGGTDIRRYESADNPEIEIEVSIASAARGNDTAELGGTIQIVAPARGEAVEMLGDCRR